jgi:hypothetical protein
VFVVVITLHVQLTENPHPRIQELEQQLEEKDAIIAQLTEERDYYREKWIAAEDGIKMMQEEERCIDCRQKRFGG